MAADKQVQQGRVRDLCAGQDPALDPQRAEERGDRVQEQGHEQDVNLELLEGINGGGHHRDVKSYREVWTDNIKGNKC